VAEVRRRRPTEPRRSPTKRHARDPSGAPLAFSPSPEVFRGILDATSDLVAVHDLEFRYLAFNEAYRTEFARIFGVELRVGDSLVDALARLPRDQAAAIEIVQRALRGETFTIAQEFGDERRARQWYELRFSPLRDHRGEIVGAAHAVRDVTEKHKVEDALREANLTLERRVADRTAALALSEERLRALMDHFPGAIFMKDRASRLLLMNQECATIMGVERSAALGKSDDEIYEDQEVGRRMIENDRKVLESGASTVFEEVVPREDGEHTYLAVKTPLADEHGEIYGLFGIATDITDRKRMEEALREADRRKGEFLGVLSHELRNPLAPLRNALWLLDKAEPGSARATRSKEIIDRQVAHLTRIVDDLLDVTRITQGKIHLQKARIDLLELVRRTMDDHRSLFSDRDVALSARLPHLPIWIDADATRVSQAVGNLLQNAAKFTDSGGHVEVAADRDAHGMAVVRVRDDGVGMEPAILERIFEPFTQADETLHRSRGGLGLGLSLVKGLAELHGGSVEARSDGPGRGSELVLRLPLAPEQRVIAGKPRNGKSAPMPSRRVLVIEDNLDAADTLREMLETWGHEVELACDGRAGVEKARAFRPDVVLCDIGLPVMDGYEVARAIRSDPEIASTFLVAVTGYALPEDQRRAAEAGFTRHLGKPVPVDVIEEVLASAPRRSP
jgi:PAS domain S-box-containing protein